MIVLMVVGAALSVLIPFLIYRWILKGEERKLKTKDYVVTFLLSATVYMIPIIVLQLCFDRLLQINAAETTTIGMSVFICFVRAALLEEGTKYFFTYMTVKRRPDLGMRETVLLAGLIGIGFGFLEKLVQGGGALIVNAIIPGHMLFQWIMGYYIGKALRSEEKRRRKYFAYSFLVPFAVHGLWDLGLDLSDILMEKPGDAMVITGFAVMAAMIVLYFIVTFMAIRKVKQLQD